MFGPLCYSAITGFVVTTPSYSSPPTAVRRAHVLISAEAEAKAAWLAKLDAPAWSALAKAVSEVATEAKAKQEEKEGSTAVSEEQEAKQAWLSKLDVPSWGKAAEAIEAITHPSVVEAQPELAFAAIKKANEEEEAAKRVWLAKLDVPSWGKISEEEAKQAWLAKLDVPSWGGQQLTSDEDAWSRAADAMITVAAEAHKLADLAEECDAGDDAACEALSKEDEAKKAWLAKLDVPSWGRISENEIEIGISEDEAKRAWLSKLDDAPSWLGKVTPTSPASQVILF